MDRFKILPTEITLDILSRVPTESALDCKLVCRNWRNLVSHHPLFSKMHLHHLNHPSDSAAHSGKFGFIALTGKKNLYYFENHDESTTVPIERITRFNFTLPFEYFQFVGSCNGMICLVDLLLDPSVCICNPITREYVMLPKINTHSIGFGYVPSTNDYKVVGIYLPDKPQFEEVHIYTLGTGNGWRNLGNPNFEFNPLTWCEAGIFANGALYWLDTKLEMIITFDLAEEQFCQHLSPPPLPPHSYWCDARIGILDRFLYFGVCYWVEGVMINDIWLLEKKNRNYDTKEGEEHQPLVWIKEFRIDISQLFAVTKSDRVLTYGGHNLSIYDTKTSTSKRLVEFNSRVRQVSPHQNTLVSLKELGEEDTKVRVS